MKNNPQLNVGRKSTAILALPLLVLPFLTLGFWSLGGGNPQSSQQVAAAGLNLKLPNAALKSDDGENKLGFYEQADLDSARHQAQSKASPLYPLAFEFDSRTAGENNRTPGYDPMPVATGTDKDSNVANVYRKLAQLNQQLQESTTRGEKVSVAKTWTTLHPHQELEGSPDDHFAATHHRIAPDEEKAPNDPELAQLGGLLDKIRAIQQPGADAEPLSRATDPTARQYEIRKLQPAASVSLLDSSLLNNPLSDFYDLGIIDTGTTDKVFRAEVHKRQRLTDGALIKLRLLDPLLLGAIRIPSGNFLYGSAALRGDRLQVTITSIRYLQSLFPVRLEVYDLDGLPGIYVPEVHAGNELGQNAANSMPLLQMASLDPSLKVQAATAGISAAKSLLSKKQKKVNIEVPDGYRLLLTNKTE